MSGQAAAGTKQTRVGRPTAPPQQPRGRLSRYRDITALILSVVLPPAGAAGSRVALVAPPAEDGPIAFALSELSAALREKGFSVTRLPWSKHLAQPLLIAFATPETRGLPSWGLTFPKLPGPEESFALCKLVRQPQRLILVAGSDPVGAMYGGLELAEQIRWVKGSPDLFAAVKEVTKAPYLRLRGVNAFITVQALEDPQSWYFSEDFWRGYVDLLARSRFNLLDLHGAYNLTSTGFHNLFPYLVYLDEYPHAGVSKAEAERNLAMLRRAINFAKARGIKVGLMNYQAAARVPAERLADYTAKCVAKLLRELPDLALLGFRIGETRQPEDFFKRGYLAGVQAVRPRMPLYTRSWLASRQQIMELAAAHRGPLLVEVKYNGEHLGLPYQVQGNRMSQWGSYSFQTYTNYPRNYTLLWQVRAGGTHRIFHWADPGFVRRVVESCRLGEAAGFTIEPIEAYFPFHDYITNPSTFPQPFFRWMFQRHWFWYQVWGRIGYDPTTSEDVFLHLMEEKYGPEAGPKLYRALKWASRIVPTIYAYHCLGPDHRDMAPELETGNGHRRRRLDDGRVEIHHGDLADFVRVEPLDDSVMCSPREYVRAYLAGEPCPQLGPLQISPLLDHYASSTLSLLTGLQASAQPALTDLRMDLEALAALGYYYAAKLRAAAEYEFFRQAGDVACLRRARNLVSQAITHWHKLAEITGRHFRPLPERLRMCNARFTWREEGQDLPADLAYLDAVRRDFLARLPAPNEMPRLGHVPVRRAQPGRPIRLRATLATQAPTPKLTAYYRCRPDEKFGAVKMERSDPELPIYQAVLPAPPLGTKEITYYLRAVVGGLSTTLPRGAPANLFSVLVTEDSAPPHLASVEHTTIHHRDGSCVTVQAQVRDPAGVALVRLVYKPLPSFYSWRTVRMAQTAKDRYSATIPLTPEGLMYRLEAADRVGNACQWPDFRVATPYRVLPSWQPTWHRYGCLEVPEGTWVYEPRVGAHPFIDRSDRITRLPSELQGLIGWRVCYEAVKKAQAHRFGGYPFAFRLRGPARLFVVFMEGQPEEGFVVYKRKAYRHDRGPAWTIYARDYGPGPGRFAFTRSAGAILGFRPLSSAEAQLEMPALAGQPPSALSKPDFLTLPLPCQIYRAEKQGPGL
jgi:hypothetical protein